MAADAAGPARGKMSDGAGGGEGTVERTASAGAGGVINGNDSGHDVSSRTALAAPLHQSSDTTSTQPRDVLEDAGEQGQTAASRSEERESEVLTPPIANDSAPSPPTHSVDPSNNDSLSSFTTASNHKGLSAVQASSGSPLGKQEPMNASSIVRTAEEGTSQPKPAISLEHPEPRDSAASVTPVPAASVGQDNADGLGLLQTPHSIHTPTIAAPTSSPGPFPSSKSMPGAAHGFTAPRSRSTTSRPESLAGGSQAPKARTSPISEPGSTFPAPHSTPLHSSNPGFSGSCMGAHPTLPAEWSHAGEALNSSKHAGSTRSLHSSSRHSPSLPSLSNEALAGVSASTASTPASSSSTPRPTMPASKSNSRTSLADKASSKATDIFKVPNTVSSVPLPSLPDSYPQSDFSPNLQSNTSQHRLGEEVIAVGTRPADPSLRTTTRYSHAGFSNTQAQNTTSQHHAAAMHIQRSSAPMLATGLPSNAYGYSSPKHLGDTSFVSSPINLLSDAGFGSSSPYPPLGSQQQQRYSLPVQASSVIPTFMQPLPPHASANIASTASLRPQPTMSYHTPGSSKHLPEMHPSALEARPSISAPFPPSSSPPRKSKRAASNGVIAAPAALQQRERPDALRPLGQEICLECLMRDRDMADVEVTGPGIWSRNSDIDFEEALRAEEIAIATAQYQSNGLNGNHSGSSIGDHIDQDKRSQLGDSNGQNGIAAGSTDENFPHMLPPNFQNGRHPVSRDGGPIRSASRESSASEGGYRRQPPRRRLGSYDPLTSGSLKLWTQMNHVSSAHRYKVLADFVHEQTRLLEQERRAYELSILERERADRALWDSPAEMSSDTRSSMSSGPSAANRGATSPKLLDLRRGSKGRLPSTHYLANGMMVETIDVQSDEKEAKARARAASKGRRSFSQSPNEQRKSFAPSIKSINAPSTYISRPETMPSPTDSFAPPWMAEERRRFSSPMLSSKYRNASSDNFAAHKQYVEPAQDLRISSYSMMTPPLRGFTSPSPSRQSFQTGNSQRESRAWRKSLWPRSASASVASFPQSGSMMEMHLGISQDRHEPMPAGYTHDLQDVGAVAVNGVNVIHAPGGTWPDNASEPGDHGGINPDEMVGAATAKGSKKKRFQKLFNSLLGTHHTAEKVPATSRAMKPNPTRGPAYDKEANYQLQQFVAHGQKPQTAFNYATAYQDDYSEPLAPPPPLSYLTGQQHHARSYSSSSQSSITPSGPGGQSPRLQGQDQLTSHSNNTRPNSLTVPRNNTNSSNGYVSPSTSSSDLNRNRPSSVTSWRSSSNKTTGSPQSPRDLLSDSFAHPLPAIRQASFEGTAPGLSALDGIELPKDVDVYKLRKEKSLPALPPDEYDGRHPFLPAQDYGLHQHMPNIPYQDDRNARQISYAVPASNAAAPSTHEIYSDVNSSHQYPNMYPVTSSEWNYQTHTREDDYNGGGSIGKTPKKIKMRSRMFSFGNKKGRSSISPQPPLQSHADSGQEPYLSKGYAPHEAALQAIVRDPGDMVAYRYPSATPHA